MRRFSLYRIIVIVAMAVRFFLQVNSFNRRHPRPWTRRSAEAWEALIVRQAREYRRQAVHLQGLLIKYGQFLSTRADLLPGVFLRELETLVDQVSPVPWPQVRRKLEGQWGRIGDVLVEIGDKPVASASIGVVYRGRIKNGQEVAVKIRRPGIERIIRADFRALRIVLWLARRFSSLGRKANLPALYREMAAVIGNELDFVQELRNGEYFQDMYAHNPDIYIPRFFAELSSDHVLVMEWMEGARITDLGFIAQHGLKRERLAAALVRSYAAQLFGGGTFHADPHPGNILLKQDGTIVWIDFGMVGVIRQQDAEHIRGLIEGIVFEDVEKIIHSLERLRFLLPGADYTPLKESILFVIRAYRRKGPVKFDEQMLEKLLSDIQEMAREQPIQLPSEFAFLGRALSTVVGVLHILDPGVDLIEIGKPVVKDWISQHGADETSEWRALRWLREWSAPLRRYPEMLTHYLEHPERQLEAQRKMEAAREAIRFFARLAALGYGGGAISLVALWVAVFLGKSALAVAAGAGILAGLFVGVVFSVVQYRRVSKLG